MEEYYEEPVMDDENLVVLPPVVTPNTSQKKSEAISAGIKASSMGQDAVEAYERTLAGVDGDKFEQTANNVKESISTLLSVADQVDAQALANQLVETGNRAKDSVLGPYYAYVDSMPQAMSLSKEARDEAAYYSWLNDTMAKEWDNMSGWDIAEDIFSSIVTPNSNYRISELGEYLGVNMTGVDYLDTTSFQMQVTKAISQLPVEGRAKLLQGVVDNWEQFGIGEDRMALLDFLGKVTSFDENEQTWTHFGEITERVDQGTIALGVGKVIKSMGKAATAIRQIARLKDAEGVRLAAIAAMRGQLKGVGVDPLDGANTVVPCKNITRLTEGAPDGFETEIVNMDRQLQAIIDDFDSMGLPLTEEEKAARIDSAIKRIEAEANVTNVRMTENGNSGFTITFDTTTGRRDVSVDYTLDDIGSWTEAQQTTKAISGFWETIWSPNYRLESVRPDLTQAHNRGVLQGSKIRAAIDNVVHQVLYGLNKTEMGRVDNLLLRGDDSSKVFTYAEAVEVGIGGVKYTPKEYKAYLGIRSVYDKMHGLMNKSIIAVQKIKGIKRVRYADADYFAKVYDDVKSAIQGFSHSKYDTSYILDGKLYSNKLSADELSELYGRGYRLVRNSDDFFSAGSTSAEYAFVKLDDISETGGVVLNKVPGYVPRIHKGNNFFLKRKTQVTVGGKKVEKLVTERYADNFTDLEEFRKSLPNPDDYVIRADRQMSASELEGDIIKTYGGLFKGKRTSKPLPYGKGDVTGPRTTALESLQRYINSIANAMPLNVYREGIKQKWINSAKEAGVLRGYDGTESFQGLLYKLDPHNPKSVFFRQSHDEISLIAGVQTLDEQVALSRVMAAGRWLEGSKIPWGKNIAAMLYNNKHANAMGVLKTAAYHTMLGLGNISQVWIQASGALVALSVNPVHGLKGIQSMFEFCALDLMRHRPDLLPKLADKMDIEAWKLWDKSGMREAITHTNLDYHNVFNEVPYDAGLLRKALSKSDMFVNMGEMVYSRIAFGTAYDYVKKKLGRMPTIDDLPAIIARADDYKLNMTRANQAKFQRGLMSLPTQFMQVQTKFIEKVIGKDFTVAERLRMLSSQAALYGVTGVPFVGTVANPILDYFGINAKETSPEELTLMKKGVMGMLINDKLGMNVEVSGRMALGNDMFERLFKIGFGDMGNMLHMAMGPSFSLLEKTDDVIERLMSVSNLVYNADAVDDTMMLSAAKVIGQELLNIPASTRNAMKGWIMMNGGMYTNSAGQHIFEYRDPNFLSSLGQAMGFQSTDVTDWYELQGKVQFLSDRKAKDTMAKLLATTVTKMISAGADEQLVYGAAYNILRSSVLNKNGGEAVHKQFIKYLQTPTENWNSLTVKALEKYQNEMAEGIDAIMSRSAIRTNITLSKQLEEAGL